MTPTTGNLAAALDALSTGSDYTQGVLDVLVLLGLVRLVDGRAVPVDRVASMVLASLRAHLSDGLVVGLRWGDLDVQGLRGVDILRSIETTRAARAPQPTPARIVEAAQSVIKTRRKQGGASEDLYLMQYDLHARRYQPIGGKREPDDTDMIGTLRREMGEELELHSSPGPDDCRLSLLSAGWVEMTLSATYGILTEYTFSFYHVSEIHFPITIDNNTRWLTRDEIVAGHASDGRPITSIYQQALGWEMLDALEPGWGIGDGG